MKWSGSNRRAQIAHEIFPTPMAIAFASINCALPALIHAELFHLVSLSLQKQIGIVLTKEWLSQLQSSCGYESFTLVLEIRLMCKQPCLHHNTLKPLRTSVRESLQVHF